jgi:dynein light intermediate chain
MSSSQSQDLSFLVIPLHEPFLRYSGPQIVKENGQEDHGDDSREDDNSGGSSPDGSLGEDNSLDNILDSMFPPIRWTENSDNETELHFISHVSRIPSNRLDAVALANTLNASLDKYQAKETGVCPIRRILYDKAMDELIRQITINCIHQGQLLFRIRNELLMTIDAYRTMYKSSIGFGLRFALKSQKRSLDVEMVNKDIMSEKDELKNKLLTLQKVHEATISKHQESMSGLTTQYQEEVAKLRLVIVKQSQMIEVLNRRPIKL